MNVFLILFLSALSLAQLAVMGLMWRRLTEMSVVLAKPAALVPAGLPSEALILSLKEVDLRIAELEQQVRSQGHPVVESIPNGDRSYALAQRLARQGATAQEIAETCGLYPSEAELLQRLHAGTKH
jgi:Protein of unknown function (DUF2802)